MRRILCLLLVLCLSLPLTLAASGESVFTPGTYEGAAAGYGGDVTVSVTVDEKNILAVEVTAAGETPGISDPAIDKLPALIVEKQTIALDTVAGCTFTSSAILEAAKAALLSSGASVEAITLAPAEDAPASLETEERTADVIVIGAGGAGLTAAVEVLRAGGSVLVVDKMSSYGGNTIAAGGALNAAYTDIQKAGSMAASGLDYVKAQLALPPHDEYMARWQESVQKDLDAYLAEGRTNVFDSPDLHKLQTYVGGDYVANPKLVEILGNGAKDSLSFLEDLGMKWSPEITTAVGATWARSHQPQRVFGPKGSDFVIPQYEFVVKNGGEVILEHKVEHILMDNGRAVGVSGTTSAGQPFTYTANKSVILATGGFGANVEMRMRYNRHWANLDETVPTTNLPSATGDGIVMAEEIAANLIGMEWIQLVTGGGGFSASIANNLYLNAEGNRFVAEDSRRDVLSGAVLEQPGSFFWFLSDAHTAEDIQHGVSYDGRKIEDIVASGGVIKADTLEELAEKIGADPENVKAAVDAFNKAVKGEAADPLGRRVFEFPFDKAPYYAGRGLAMVHHTMGGVEINELCQVLSTAGEVIPGLYAAGEVTGGIHGGNRLGGNAIADIIIFGQIAGQQAMK